MRSAWLTKARLRLLRPLLWLLALNAGTFAAYTLPRSLQERNLSERTQALKADVERERNGVARFRQRAQAIGDNQRDTERFYRALPEPKELVTILRELDKVAPSTGSRSYRPGELKGAPVTRFVVTTPVSGSYEQLLAFVRAIERWREFVTIDRLALRERESGAELDVELSAYFRGAPAGKQG